MILGTGVGGGVVVHGRLVEGVNAIGGEWGHIPLPTPAATTSGPARSAPAASPATPRPGSRARASRPISPAATDRRSRTAPPAPEVVALAERGDAVAEETLRRYEDRLGRSLAVIVNMLDPDVIVLGGGLSNVARLYADRAAR